MGDMQGLSSLDVLLHASSVLEEQSREAENADGMRVRWSVSHGLMVSSLTIAA